LEKGEGVEVIKDKVLKMPVIKRAYYLKFLINVSRSHHYLLFILFLLPGCSHTSSNAQADREWRVYYYEDKEASLTESQALELFRNGKFAHLNKSVLTPGFTQSAFWIAVEPGSPSNSNQLFVVRNPHINRLWWFEVMQQTPMLLWSTGDYQPFRQRPVEYTHFAFPLNPHASVQLLKVDKRFESLDIPFQIISRDELHALDIKENLLYGMFLGIALILLTLSLYLYLSTRNKIYLLYLFHMLFQVLWWISDTGLGYRYLWVESVTFTSRARVLFTSLGMIFLLEFFSEFIKLDPSSRLSRIKRFFQILPLSVALISMVPLPSVQYPALIFALALMAASNWIFMLVFVPLILFYQWRQGVKEVNILTLSYLPYIFYGFIFLVNHFGVLPVPQILLNFMLPLSCSITMTVLIFGITMIFNRHRAENIRLLMRLNDQSKTLTKKVLEAQETERVDLGKTLHDEVAAKLSVAQLNLSALRNVLDYSHHETFEAVHSNLAEINGVIRNISHRLFSEDLEKYGLKTSLEDFFRSIQHAKAMNIEYVIDGFSKTENAPITFKKAVYRIVLELTNNCMKHSAATHIFVQLIEVDNALTIFLEDDGNGFDTNKVQDGFGLQLLKTQTSYYNGTLDIKSGVGKGTSITMEIQIPAT
jgi:two-component system, sensor histidine kinase LadS